MTNKHGADNPSQKGLRRQKLHKNQNNVGNPQNDSKFENFNGEPIK